MTDLAQTPPADKVVLSAGRRPKYRETPDVVAGARRIIGAVGKRVATEDPEDLEMLLALEDELAKAWRRAVDGLRQTGYTDGQIGEVLLITKQAVAQRWPRPSEQ